MAGFLKKKCTGCGQMIYIKADPDGVKRPYKSWVAGQVPEGEWVLHDCPAWSRMENPRGGSKAAQPRVQTRDSDDPLLLAVKLVAENYHVSQEVAVGIVGTVVRTMNGSTSALAGSSGT